MLILCTRITHRSIVDYETSSTRVLVRTDTPIAGTSPPFCVDRRCRGNGPPLERRWRPRSLSPVDPWPFFSLTLFPPSCLLLLSPLFPSFTYSPYSHFGISGVGLYFHSHSLAPSVSSRRTVYHLVLQGVWFRPGGPRRGVEVVKGLHTWVRSTEQRNTESRELGTLPF